MSVPVSFETFQPRQGFLLKLGGGQEKGSVEPEVGGGPTPCRAGARAFARRALPPPPAGGLCFATTSSCTSRPRRTSLASRQAFRHRLLEECNVRTRDDRASAQRFQFVLSHPNGESVVLAAESEKEMLEWMQAVRTSRICVADASAATQAEALRRDGAERELDGALSGGVQGDAALVSIDAELEAVQLEHRDVEIEKEKAEKELKARAPTSTRSRARSPSSSPLVPSAPPPPPPLPPPHLPSPPPPPLPSRSRHRPCGPAAARARSSWPVSSCARHRFTGATAS